LNARYSLPAPISAWLPWEAEWALLCEETVLGETVACMDLTFSESALHKIAFCKVIDSLHAHFRGASPKQAGI
jgi:hypothetical protein